MVLRACRKRPTYHERVIGGVGSRPELGPPTPPKLAGFEAAGGGVTWTSARPAGLSPSTPPRPESLPNIGVVFLSLSLPCVWVLALPNVNPPPLSYRTTS